MSSVAHQNSIIDCIRASKVNKPMHQGIFLLQSETLSNYAEYDHCDVSVDMEPEQCDFAFETVDSLKISGITAFGEENEMTDKSIDIHTEQWTSVFEYVEQDGVKDDSMTEVFHFTFTDVCLDLAKITDPFKDVATPDFAPDIDELYIGWMDAFGKM